MEYNLWAQRDQSWAAQDTALNNHMNLAQLGVSGSHMLAFLGRYLWTTEKIGWNEVENDIMIVVDVHDLGDGVLHAFHVGNHAKTWRGRESKNFSEEMIITKG